MNATTVQLKKLTGPEQMFAADPSNQFMIGKDFVLVWPTKARLELIRVIWSLLFILITLPAFPQSPISGQSGRYLFTLDNSNLAVYDQVTNKEFAFEQISPSGALWDANGMTSPNTPIHDGKPPAWRIRYVVSYDAFDQYGEPYLLHIWFNWHAGEPRPEITRIHVKRLQPWE